MSKYDSLLKQSQVFEKIAVYGNRKDFLESLAQNLTQGTVVFPDESINSALASVAGAAGNLGRLLEESQLASTYELEMAKKISTSLEIAEVPTYVTTKAELDAKAGPINALLANAVNIGNRVSAPNFSVDQQAKEVADQLKNEASRAISIVNNFYKKNGINVNVESPEAARMPAPAQPQVNIADAAKNLAKSLEAKLVKLTTGPQRTAQLKDIDNGVKVLQNYFRALQKKVNIEGYFARIEITNALQKIYSTLEYDDLEAVQSLQAGRGVPENPDSKI